MPSTNTTEQHAATQATDKPVRVGDLLLARGLISNEQIDQALAFQRDNGHRKLLGEILVELGFVTNELVMEVLAEAYNVPYERITPHLADPKVIGVLPRDFLEKQNALPLFLVNGKLTVALAEPANVFLVEEIARMTGHTVQLVASPAKDIQTTLQTSLPNGNVFVIDDMVRDSDLSDLQVIDREVTDLAEASDGGNDSPVIKLVNHLMYAATEEGASDIHIEAGDGEMRVRFRVDGALYEKMRPPYKMLPAVVSRIKIMAGMDISERRVPQDGGISVMMRKNPIDMRVSTMPGKYGEKVVIRIIDNRKAMTNLDGLGLDANMLTRLRHVINQPNGIVLVTGPTGSGKSSTLYSMLGEINDAEINICTVEDPVEYHVSGINQFQVNEKAGFTFSGALRSLLRQDPDVIMLGEIRDHETAKIATQAALTGHLVLSTLHTNDAPSAVTRLLNIGVESYLVAASVRATMAQRLLRRVCPHCKEAVDVSPNARRLLDRLGDEGTSIDKLHQGVGCTRCRNTGYAGRLGIFELFVPEDETLDAISRGASLQEIRRIAKASGHQSLADDGLKKVRAGLTSLDELVKAAAMA